MAALTNEALDALVASELRRAVPPPVASLAQQLAQRAAGHAAAVLFYGSALSGMARGAEALGSDVSRAQGPRTDPSRPKTPLAASLEGVLDLYVLLDRVGAWPGSRIAAFANRVLPPNVGYFQSEVGGRVLRAKYAVMSMRQFQRGMSPRALDTTLWARFSQPCVCTWVRSDTDFEAVGAAVRDAVVTAARWAAELGPERTSAVNFWRALFARTYAAELRVEQTGRPSDIVGRDPSRYERALPLAWRAAGIAFDVFGDEASPGKSSANRVLRDEAPAHPASAAKFPAGYAGPVVLLTPHVNREARRAAARQWERRRRLGKPLNLIRLLKAALTFEGALDYVAWKVERHSGVRLTFSPWQRRFPLLAAPGIYRRLRKRGVLR